VQNENDDCSCFHRGNYNPCPSIELSCTAEQGTRYPTPSPTVAPTQNPTEAPTTTPTYNLPDTAPILNFYTITLEQRVVGINFDERRYKSVVEEDERLGWGYGLVFLDQYVGERAKRASRSNTRRGNHSAYSNRMLCDRLASCSYAMFV